MSRPLDRLSWALGFAQMGFGAVRALEGKRLTVMQDQLHAFVIAQLGRPALGTEQVRRLTQEGIWNLRGGLKERIAAARTLTGWAENLPRRLTFDAAGAPHVRPDGKDLPTLFYNCAFDLVAAEGARIAKCARRNCDNLLVREGRSIYCSSRCSQYTRTMKHRQKQNEADNV